MSHITTKIRLYFPTGYEPRDIIGTSSFDWIHPDGSRWPGNCTGASLCVQFFCTPCLLPHVQLEFCVHPFLRGGMTPRWPLRLPGSSPQIPPMTTRSLPSPHAQNAQDSSSTTSLDNAPHVLHNDCIFPTRKVFNQHFYDFACPRDEVNMRQWINVSKGWGVRPHGRRGGCEGRDVG